jgi:chromosome segregation ATPase
MRSRINDNFQTLEIPIHSGYVCITTDGGVEPSHSPLLSHQKNCWQEVRGIWAELHSKVERLRAHGKVAGFVVALIRRIRKIFVIGYILTTHLFSTTTIKLPVLEKDVGLMTKTLLIGKNEQATMAVIKRGCRDCFDAGLNDLTKLAGNVDALLMVAPQFNAEYEDTCNYLITIFKNQGLLREYLRYLPHLLYPHGLLDSLYRQDSPTNFIKSLGFEIQEKQAREKFEKIGSVKPNDAHVKALTDFLLIGTNNATGKKTLEEAVYQCLYCGLNNPYDVGLTVDALLGATTTLPTSLPDSYLFGSLRNIALDQSHFAERLELLQKDLEENKAYSKSLFSALFDLNSGQGTEDDSVFGKKLDACFAAASDGDDGVLKTKINQFLYALESLPLAQEELFNEIKKICLSPDDFGTHISTLRQEIEEAQGSDKGIALSTLLNQSAVIAQNARACLGGGGVALDSSVSKLLYSLETLPFSREELATQIKQICANPDEFESELEKLQLMIEGSSPTSVNKKRSAMVGALLAQSDVIARIIYECLEIAESGEGTIAAKLNKLVSAIERLPLTRSELIAEVGKVCSNADKFEENLDALQQKIDSFPPMEEPDKAVEIAKCFIRTEAIAAAVRECLSASTEVQLQMKVSALMNVIERPPLTSDALLTHMEALCLQQNDEDAFNEQLQLLRNVVG